MPHVVLQLTERGVEVFAARFHFNGDMAFPEVINLTCFAGGQRNLELEIAQLHGIVHAEHAQKIRYKTLRYGFLVMRVFPAL